MIKKTELLGVGKNLKCESPGPLTLAVFSIKESFVTDRERLATFEATAREVSFRWNQGPRLGEGRQSAVQNDLRDCIVKITSAGDEARYCVLRGEPSEPQSVEERLKVNYLGGLTQQRFTWDAAKSFSETKRPVHIAQCRLWKQAAREELPLERQEDESWVSKFEGDRLLTVKLDESEILTILQDSEPSRLEDRIHEQGDQIKSIKSELTEAEETVNSKKRSASTEEIERLKRRLTHANTKRRKLERLLELYQSHLDAVIVYEVAGHKFQIARVDRRPNVGQAAPPN